MKKYQKGTSILLFLLVVIILVGVAQYIFNYFKIGNVINTPAENAQSTDKTPSAQTQAENQPVSGNTLPPGITSITPSLAAVGSRITIKGTNFNPPLDANAQTTGWATHSHIFVYVMNSSGQQGILWEDSDHGAPNDTISFLLPLAACEGSITGSGGCQPVFNLTRGTYTLTVSVDKRGTSRPVIFTVE